MEVKHLLRKPLSVEDTRPLRLFIKNTALCKHESGRIGCDACPVLFSPIWISSLSPRNTAPNQTLAPLSRRTLPITAAVGAIQLSGWASTRASPRRYFMVNPLRP